MYFFSLFGVRNPFPKLMTPCILYKELIRRSEDAFGPNCITIKRLRLSFKDNTNNVSKLFPTVEERMY